MRRTNSYFPVINCDNSIKKIPAHVRLEYFGFEFTAGVLSQYHDVVAVDECVREAVDLTDIFVFARQVDESLCDFLQADEIRRQLLEDFHEFYVALLEIMLIEPDIVGDK